MAGINISDLVSTIDSSTLGGLIKGQSDKLDLNGKKFNLGFTPYEDFYLFPDNKDLITGIPLEAGVLSNTLFDGVTRNTNDILDTDIPTAYKAFDNDSSEEFRHHLDRGKIPIPTYNPETLSLTKTNDIYLSSFVETDTNNEDPISFSYDIIINYDNSPLFNGAVEDFINTFSSYTEISSRLDIIDQFKTQFFRFFKINSPNSLPNNITDVNKTRTYYLKKITGLDNLTESLSLDKPKQFIDYGKDFITLTLNEDISVNMGYLSSLYKILTWSRVHGKKMIPDNLLRFDIEIVITEARKFNRVIKNGTSVTTDTLEQYADSMSRYRYKIYECQFFFDNMTHGDSIDMWNLGFSDGFDIKFNYKYSNVKFEYFKNSPTTIQGDSISRNHFYNDNSMIDLSLINSADTTNSYVINNSIVNFKPDYILNKYSSYSPDFFQQNTDAQLYLGFTYSGNDASNLDQMDQINKNKKKNLIINTLQNISSSFNAGLKRTIYTFKEDLLSFIPLNILGGFTPDGYEYNIPAYTINKAFNTINSSLQETVNIIREDIYEYKTIFLNEIMNSSGNNSNNLNIYGNGEVTPIINSGTFSALSDLVYTQTPNTHIYDYEPIEPDTPPHTTGNPLAIYDYEPIYPDTPPHDTGSPLAIYDYEPIYPDDPPHTTGSPLAIYDYEPIYPDTPPHDTGSPLAIYDYEPVYPDTPTHDTGSSLNIYDYNPMYNEDPIGSHTTGVSLDIYNYNPMYPDTPGHTIKK